MSASDQGELRYHDDVLVVHVRRTVLAIAWYDAPRSGHLLEVSRQVQAVHRATNLAPALFNVVVRGTPRFPDDVREEGARLVRETSGFHATTAHIVEVDGFAGSATRMFLSAMVMFARPRPTLRVFADHREGAKWLQEVSDPRSGVTVAQLIAHYEVLKAIEPKAPKG